MRGKKRRKGAGKKTYSPHLDVVDVNESQLRPPSPETTFKPAKSVESKKSRFSSGYAIWSIIWGVLGPIIMLYNLAPDISMVSQQAPDPKNVYSVPFQIHNSSAFAIRDVRVTCDQRWTSLSALVVKSSSRDPNGTILEVAKHETATTSCYSEGDRTAESSHNGSIFFHLRFKYVFWPFDVTRHFEFQVSPNGDQFVLTPQPTGVWGFADQPIHSVDGR